jgi:hypothetical protein
VAILELANGTNYVSAVQAGTGAFSFQTVPLNGQIGLIRIARLA